jgi:acyl carrier protein
MHSGKREQTHLKPTKKHSWRRFSGDFSCIISPSVEVRRNMNRDQIEQIILETLRMVNLAREDDKQLTVAPDAPLFGNGGQLDSMGLLALIIDVEEALEAAGYHIILTAERAMSSRQSPFRDVPSLVAYIEHGLVA